MSKHTLGPWHLQDNDGAYVMVRGNPSPGHNGESIAKVWLKDNDFNEANAQLIAAAPDMFKALERIRKAFPSCEGLNTAQSMALGSALNAIAKAEGIESEEKS